jgi:hypothetical protein
MDESEDQPRRLLVSDRKPEGGARIEHSGATIEFQQPDDRPDAVSSVPLAHD